MRVPLPLVPLGVVLIVSVGCNSFGVDGVFESGEHRVKVAHYDATQRGTFFTFDGGRIRSVSEPPPDVALQETLSLLQKAEITTGGGDELTAENKLEYARNVVELGKRTQAVQILRDALFRLSELTANDPEKLDDTARQRLYLVVMSAATTVALADRVSSELGALGELTKQHEKAQTDLAAMDAQLESLNASLETSRNATKSQGEIDGMKAETDDDKAKKAAAQKERDAALVLQRELEADIAAIETRRDALTQVMVGLAKTIAAYTPVSGDGEVPSGAGTFSNMVAKVIDALLEVHEQITTANGTYSTTLKAFSDVADDDALEAMLEDPSGASIKSIEAEAKAAALEFREAARTKKALEDRASDLRTLLDRLLASTPSDSAPGPYDAVNEAMRLLGSADVE